MIKIKINENDGNQRLDRFLKKYLENAPLSMIYKMIRKDIKVNGKRCKNEMILQLDDEVSIYLSDQDIEQFQRKKTRSKVKKQFMVTYEDENIIVVEKPFGLLTHGDSTEKKNHLANQVCDYLIDRGEYNPRVEKTFSPASVNRLDRNTTGLVLFGKNSSTLQQLNQMIREKDKISKFYMTIVKGRISEPMILKDKMEKDHEENKVTVLPLDSEDGKLMETWVRPLRYGNGYTLIEVEIITGRTHQIRAHLAEIGHPVIGDTKYGDRRVNEKMRYEFGLSTQLLHAYKLKFNKCSGNLQYLEGKEIVAPIPADFERIKNNIFEQ
ncbi:MAG: RluA family pseudouridine synthase [Anaerovoracaceae bacterium]